MLGQPGNRPGLDESSHQVAPAEQKAFYARVSGGAHVDIAVADHQRIRSGNTVR